MQAPYHNKDFPKATTRENLSEEVFTIIARHDDVTIYLLWSSALGCEQFFFTVENL